MPVWADVNELASADTVDITMSALEISITLAVLAEFGVDRFNWDDLTDAEWDDAEEAVASAYANLLSGIVPE